MHPYNGSFDSQWVSVYKKDRQYRDNDKNNNAFFDWLTQNAEIIKRL